ncbi:MAG: hypothetical protein J1F11_07395 [Oscillospiraceae bacterium]|nr:hypothetical protein [Oscillospiraceae bacterium]
MELNKRTNKSFVEVLDHTAETNPLLWLPCVTLLGAVLGTRRLVNDIRTVLSPVKDDVQEVSCHAAVSDRPAYVRAVSAFLAAAMLMTFTPGLNGISVTNAFAEEAGIEAETADQENVDTENNEAEGQDTEQKTESKAKASKKSKKDIKITLNCMLKGMTSGNAHATINKSYLDNSADVWLMSSDASRKDAEAVMMQLGANAAYYVCYPFEINIYDADSKELIELPEDGIASFEMPVPKIMSTCADKIKVYHVVDGHPDFIESELSTEEDGTQTVKFSASKFSTYIFVAPAPAKDNSGSKDTASAEADKDKAADKDNTAPAASEDKTASENTAPADDGSTAPEASEDKTASENAAPANEDNTTPEVVPYTADNDESAVNDDRNYGLEGEDVSSAAGAYASSVPMETAAMPSGSGAAPVWEAPERLRLSNKKRRYRIIRKRRLDDMVFVL